MKDKPKHHFDASSPRREKIRILFFPCLKLAFLSMTILLTCFIVLEWIYGGYGAAEIGIFVSLLLSLVPLWFIDKRLALIESTRWKNTGFINFLMILTFIPAGFMFLSAINVGSSQIVPLERIGQVVDPALKYCTVRDYLHSPSRDYFYSYGYFRKDSKKSRKEQVIVYCVAPLYNPDAQLTDSLTGDPTEVPPAAWIGIEYQSGYESAEEIRKSVDQFVERSRERFPDDIRRPFVYLKKVKSDDSNGFYRALAARYRNSYQRSTSQIILTPSYQSTAQFSLTWTVRGLLVLAGGVCLLFVFIWFTPINEKNLEKYLTGKSHRSDPDLVPPKAVKGILQPNHKLVIIHGVNREQISAIMTEMCDIYNEDEILMYAQLTELDTDRFVITFPYDIDLTSLCYLVNFIVYNSQKLTPEVTGWTQAAKGEPWITPQLVGRWIMLYIPKEDSEYDNVYVAADDGSHYRFDFDGKLHSDRGDVRPYDVPPFEADAAPQGVWNKVFS